VASRDNFARDFVQAAEESAHGDRSRLIVDLPGGPLLVHLTVDQDGDRVGQEYGLLVIVGHEHDRWLE
jgi:hypothetical protein